jgi:hypothetical protein
MSDTRVIAVVLLGTAGSAHLALLEVLTWHCWKYSLGTAGSNFLLRATRLPKGNYFLEGPQDSPVCPDKSSTKMKMSM